MRQGTRLTAALAASTTALAGLAGYLAPLGAQAAPATDLMISTYIEGSANNKALELHNASDQAIDLSGYTVELYSNGSTTPSSTETLSGQLASGDHLVLVNHQAGAELSGKGDLVSSVTNFNGDDAVVLRKGTTTIDSLGQVGTRSNWAGMKDATLTNNTCEVDTDPSDAFTVANFAQSAQDDFTTLGTVNCADGTTPEPTPEPTPTIDPTPEPVEPTAIGAVQGEADAAAMAGQTVTVKGTITAAYLGQNTFGGYYIQDGGDDNPATSDAIFVYAPQSDPLPEGACVVVTGQVSDYYDQTQITAQGDTGHIGSGTDCAPVEPTPVELPVTDWERYEGMLLEFPQTLSIAEFYQYGRYGEIVLATERQYQPTTLIEPGQDAIDLFNAQARQRITLDDGRSNQNPSPAIHPDGEKFTLEHTFRGGDTLTGTTGVLSYRNNAYKLQPRKDWFGATYEATNPRPEMPVTEGDFRIASFNVLNYFTTLGSAGRGAADAEEFERQQQKIVAALAEIDADVVGLIEIENNGTALTNLVTALNQHIGSEAYAAVNTGKIGTDQIATAFIYKLDTTETVGNWDAYDAQDGKNRPALTQRFRHVATSETVSVNVNHFKSKGSACSEDPNALNVVIGNCNDTRERFAGELVEWLEAKGYADDRMIIMGDLNSYALEDPIDVLTEAGYTDMERKFNGSEAYSYVFDGRLGYLDYAMANDAAEADIVDTQSWHINADEPSIIDYTMKFKAPAEDALWAADPYRSSDHDPVIIGMKLAADEPVEQWISTNTAGQAPTGSTANVWGTAHGAEAGDRIVVQALINGNWVNSRETTLNEDLGYVLPLSYGQNTPGKQTYRTVAITDRGYVVSDQFTFTRTQVSVNHANVKKVGQTTYAWGTAHGAEAGDRAVVQTWINGHWINSQETTIGDSLGYLLPLTYGQNRLGIHTFRVVVETDNGYLISNTFSLTRTLSGTTTR